MKNIKKEEDLLGYCEKLEDALLFVDEKQKKHEWRVSSFVLDISPPISEYCVMCGIPKYRWAVDNICLGNREAQAAIFHANNRRKTK